MLTFFTIQKPVHGHIAIVNMKGPIPHHLYLYQKLAQRYNRIKLCHSNTNNGLLLLNTINNESHRWTVEQAWLLSMGMMLTAVFRKLKQR